MGNETINAAVTGAENPPVATAEQIGEAAKKLADLTELMSKAAKDGDGRYDELRTEQVAQANVLNELKDAADKEKREAEVTEAIAQTKAMSEWAQNFRQPSKANLIGSQPRENGSSDDDRGAFIFGVFQANSRDTERQAEGKAILAALRTGQADASKAVTDIGKAVLESIGGQRPDAKAYLHEDSWGKATLGTTDATGGWILPNAIVDEFIKPAAVENIYRRIMTVVPGVTATAVDIPFRSGVRTRAVIAPWGDTKENLNLAYNGYTATMYTLARIYDLSNQFLRASRGAAEADVLSELAAAFAAGESYYIREGSGTNEPFGYTSALTSGPAAFTSAFSPVGTTLAGSIAAAIATAGGALAGRGVTPDGAVLSATSYWTMLSQGSDTAGFWFATQENNPASVPVNTLVSPFGIPVYPDAAANVEGTAAVVDNLVLAQWKRFKVYFGESYRVDSSDQAGTRWDTNLTGFRGEEEMGFDARPVVYAGYAQIVTDIVP